MPTIDDLMETLIPEAENIPYFRGALYGAEGSTKTVSACSVGNRVLLVETDPGGSVSLFNHPKILHKTQRMRYQGVSQIQFLAESINEPQFDPYDTIVIDTVSQMVSQSLDTITVAKKAKGEEIPDWPVYRLSQNVIRRAITTLVANAKKHIILTSHMRLEKDNRGITRTTLDMPQAVRGDITRLCHIVGYLTAELEDTEDGVVYERQMQVHPTKLIVAKSRIGGLPTVIKNPDLGQIVEEWVKQGAAMLDVAEPPVPETEGVLGTETNTPEEHADTEPSSGLEL